MSLVSFVKVTCARHNQLKQAIMDSLNLMNEGHFIELQHFINCLIKDQPPSPSGEDGLKDLQVIEQAYKNQIRLDQPQTI